MKKRWVSLLLACIMIVAAIPAFNVYADEEVYYFVNQNYEGLEVTENFNSNFDGLGASFISEDSKIKVVGPDLSLLGKRSLAVNKCDMRWLSLSLTDEKMFAEVTVRADSAFDNELNLFFTTKQPSENLSEKATVNVFSIKKDKTNVVLKDCNGNLITVIEEDIRYSVRCEFTRGSDLYNIYVNNELLSKDCKSGVKVYSVEDFHVKVDSLAAEEGGAEGSSLKEPYILIDNIAVSAKGKLYPQGFSAQEKGELPQVLIPETPKSDDIRVFVNTTELAMASAPVVKKDTVYIDLEQMARCLNMTLKDDAANKSFVLSNENVTVEASLGSKKIKINGQEYNISYAPEKINRLIMVTPNFLSEALNAKVWWDDKADMIVITTGQYKKDGILRQVGGKLYMNGEPYYEISFNKFDLFDQILASYEKNAEYTGEELKQLNMLGFKTIRVFAYSNVYTDLMHNDKHQDTYFKAMDHFFDLCDEYDIKVVVSMGLIEPYLLENIYVEGEGWITGTENLTDLVKNRDSKSRNNLYKYIEKFITRYKDRASVLMWELSSEGNLHADDGAVSGRPSYSLLQLAQFYSDCADRIREFDKEHLITGGDGVLRSSQWNLFKDVMNGSEFKKKTDTKEERLKALALLNERLDVISVHTYGIGFSNESSYLGSNGKIYNCDFLLYMQEANLFGKALYNGETNSGFSAESEDFYTDTRIYLNSIIEAGVQLSHWWTFPLGGQGDSELIELVVNANKLLKENYCNNKAENENTTDAWEDPSFQVLDITKITDGKEFAVRAGLNSKLIRFAIVSGVMLFATIVCVVALTREKLKRKRTEEIV